MSTEKTNKSFAKRLKVTRTGKVLARKPGFNHFNAKQSRSKQLNGKVPVLVVALDRKTLGRFLPHA
jgi:ribosomal protein L35